jgi:hypothetical protein
MEDQRDRLRTVGAGYAGVGSVNVPSGSSFVDASPSGGSWTVRAEREARANASIASAKERRLATFRMLEGRHQLSMASQGLYVLELVQVIGGRRVPALQLPRHVDHPLPRRTA